MKNPYIIALNRPCAGVDEPFIKKETVIGTIGNTHGVSSIANPQRIASRISAQIESPSVLSEEDKVALSTGFGASPGRLMLKS